MARMYLVRRRTARHQPIVGPLLVEPALRRLGLLLKVQEQQVLRAFAHAAGPHIQPRARAERFSHGVLYIRVESSAWANEIAFAKAPLLERLHELPGGDRVRDVRFTIGPLDELPTWQDPPRPAPPALRPLPVDPRVAAALTQVGDDDLRDALGSLYVSACRAGKKGE